MSIDNRSVDEWGSKVYDLPFSLYLYYLNSELDSDGTNSAVLSNMTGLISVNYTPFLNPSDLDLYKIPYDYERFDKINSDIPPLTKACDVYRISNLHGGTKKLANFSAYPIVNKSIGGARSWVNESKLLNYPYSRIEINDGINPPLVLRPELCPYEAELWVKHSLSDRCSYGLYVKGYKGDLGGNVEALVSGDGTELPSTTSQWANWVATSKNQTTQNVNNAIAQSRLGEQFSVKSGELGMLTDGIGAIGGVLSSAMMGNVGGAVMGGIQGVGQYFQNKMSIEQAKAQGQMDRQQTIQSALAQAKDMRTAPNTLISQGSNIMYGLFNNNRYIRLYRFGITDEYAQRIGDYFALYGYKQNKMMIPDTRSRINYNYVKLLQCNIMASDIPQSHLDELKAIYEKGVRIWHVDNYPEVIVGDYSKDNAERF
ncbi:tail fibers protein [Clostridium phage CPD7]|uniref:Tail fibers protein n=1 Tax=Clostridium phage CPD7 TaxID=2483608 RepID=A0A5H2TKP6_9CAUD|nr:tail fibers protein [Clostridium phage CPD7]